MAKFRIISNHQVCGHAPGSIVEDDELVGGDVAHLMGAGHITPVRAGKNSEPKGDAANDNEEQ